MCEFFVGVVAAERFPTEPMPELPSKGKQKVVCLKVKPIRLAPLRGWFLTGKVNRKVGKRGLPANPKPSSPT